MNSSDQSTAGSGAGDGAGGAATTAPASRGVPKRFVVVALCFVAFMLCNMDRVNMSIAILPMQQEFGWTPQTVGIVQSSFFWCATDPLTRTLGKALHASAPVPALLGTARPFARHGRDSAYHNQLRVLALTRDKLTKLTRAPRKRCSSRAGGT